MLVGRQAQGLLVAFGRQGLAWWYVTDDVAIDTIFLSKQVGDAVANGDHLIQVGHNVAFYPFPHTLHLGSIDQLGRLGEILMTIKDHLAAFQTRDAIIGQNSVQVVG